MDAKISNSDKIHVGTTKNYWQYLSEMLGLELLDYGIISSRTNLILTEGIVVTI